ncbi:MAG TPA: imidazole glycerol phosphate synthase subunit HisH [Candidatus Acidoferrum sp.]
MNVVIIDYGAGNVPSVATALRRLGVEATTTNEASELARADRIILPGVGHCAALIHALDAQGIRKPLADAISRGVPFLGICLGLQALYEASDEAPDLAGLGIFTGKVAHLPANVKLPHMGWNQLQRVRASMLLQNIACESYFYFAHTFGAPGAGSESVAVCHHGREFTAVLEYKNIFGVQFHPEKSGAPGAKLLENFLRQAA